MGGRGTFAKGNNVALSYQNVEKIHDVWAVKGINGEHSLPEESRNSNAYIKLDFKGNFREIRVYNNDHTINFEIAYHPEPNIDKSGKPVFHIHYYNKNGTRGNAEPVSKTILEKYKKYFKGVKIWLIVIMINL